MVRIASIAFALALSACAERPAVEDSSADTDPVERQKMTAQELHSSKRTYKVTSSKASNATDTGCMN